MRIFDSKGRFYIPDQNKCAESLKNDIAVFDKCYCHNGHNLVSGRAKFGDCHGIVIKAKNSSGIGYIALSPIWGDKSRMHFDINLINGETLELICPECNEPLHYYSKCTCGGEMVTLFLSENKDYMKCIGICNRVGCPHSEFKTSDELFRLSRV